MIRTFWTIFCLCVCGLALAAQAENFSLADGTTLSGDPVTFGDTGIILKTPDDKYTERMPWTKFSAAGLDQLAQNPKIKPFVEPFIPPPPAERTQSGDDVKVGPVTRLDLPPHKFILLAMASSSVGFFLLFVVYIANLYAAFEIAACRGRSKTTVMGLSAVLPVVGPAIFFLMPIEISEVSNSPVAIAEAAAAAAAAAAEAAHAAHPGGAEDVAAREAAAAAAAAAAEAARNAPVVQTFKRGQFTFNRRFIEGKFAGFMAPVRSEADQKLEFTLKAVQGTYVVERISQVGTSEIHLEVLQDQQPAVVQVPFADIQEITLKTRKA